MRHRSGYRGALRHCRATTAYRGRGMTAGEAGADKGDSDDEGWSGVNNTQMLTTIISNCQSTGV